MMHFYTTKTDSTGNKTGNVCFILICSKKILGCPEIKTSAVSHRFPQL